MSELRARLREAHLYLVCDEQREALLRAAMRGGVEIVQLRMKDASDERIVAVGRRMRALCDEHGVLFVLNDRPALMAAVGADGVHLGQEDMPVAEARRIVGPERLIGLSTHSQEQVSEAVGVDYIGVGPVYETPTKPGRPAVGLELVRYASEHARVPFFAIGGIDMGNVDAVRDAGARRVAVVRALTQAENPERIARELRAAFAVEGERVGA